MFVWSAELAFFVAEFTGLRHSPFVRLDTRGEEALVWGLNAPFGCHIF